MNRSSHNIRCRHRGGAMLELALAMSLLTTLAFGTIEFGYALYCKNILAEAAKNGARAAIVPGTTSSGVKTAVADALAATGWSSSLYTVAITNTSGTDISSSLSTLSAGTQVEITVSGTWGNLGAGFNPLHLIPSGKTLSGVSVMREQP